MAYSGSAADRLAAVQAAIGECLSSQSMSSRSGMRQMAQLSELRAMEVALQRELGFEQNGGGMCSLGFSPKVK